MALTFALPPGASEPREPYEHAPVELTDNPEADLHAALARIAREVGDIQDAVLRGIIRGRKVYHASEHLLERAERAATALNTATAIYRARRQA